MIRINLLINPLSELIRDIQDLNSNLDFEKRIASNIDDQKITDIIRKKPLIDYFLKESYSYFHVSYGSSNLEIYKEIIHVYNQLLGIMNQFHFKIMQSLNPLTTVTFILQLPANLFSLLGIKFSITGKRLFSLIIWLIPLIATIFSEDFRSWLLSLF
jgi:hypothetical protein